MVVSPAVMVCDDSSRREVLRSDAGDTDEMLEGSHGLKPDP